MLANLVAATGAAMIKFDMAYYKKPMHTEMFHYSIQTETQRQGLIDPACSQKVLGQ